MRVPADQAAARELTRKLGRLPTHTEVQAALRARPAAASERATGLSQTSQVRSARLGREVRALPTAAERRRRRRVRKAKRVAVHWLASIGALALGLGIVALVTFVNGG